MLRVHESEGLGDMGAPTWQVTMCLLTAYTIIYFAIWRGVKTSGKVCLSIVNHLLLVFLA